jgi:hypothetical protein
MCAKRVKRAKLDLAVVLDTNALFTGSASYFVRKEVAELVKQHSSLPDLKIKWIVPEVVRDERQFQMFHAAQQMLPTIEKLERLLGHNLNITAEILNDRVEAAVSRQASELGLAIQPLAVAEVDWQRVMRDAAYRKPPFQPGEKQEKGFRDLLILETFLQTVTATPVSRKVARVVLVSNDQLLRDAATTRVSTAENVHILESLDALKGLINALGSAVDEAVIASIRDLAAKAFFNTSDETGLYYKASVGNGLQNALAKAQVNLPATAERYSVENWTIHPPQFVKKQGQRILWTTRFEARLKAVKSSPPQQQLSEFWQSLYPSGSDPKGVHQIALQKALQTTSVPMASLSRPISSVDWGTLSTSMASAFGIQDQLVGNGTAIVDVAWSLSLTTSNKLTKLILESIDFIEVIWD